MTDSARARIAAAATLALATGCSSATEDSTGGQTAADPVGTWNLVLEATEVQGDCGAVGELDATTLRIEATGADSYRVVDAEDDEELFTATVDGERLILAGGFTSSSGDTTSVADSDLVIDGDEVRGTLAFDEDGPDASCSAEYAVVGFRDDAGGGASAPLLGNWVWEAEVQSIAGGCVNQVGDVLDFDAEFHPASGDTLAMIVEIGQDGEAIELLFAAELSGEIVVVGGSDDAVGAPVSVQGSDLTYSSGSLTEPETIFGTLTFVQASCTIQLLLLGERGLALSLPEDVFEGSWSSPAGPRPIQIARRGEQWSVQLVYPAAAAAGESLLAARGIPLSMADGLDLVLEAGGVDLALRAHFVSPHELAGETLLVDPRTGTPLLRGTLGLRRR